MATFGFNRTALRSKPKLHSMFCALFLKIALTAAELISFGHLGAGDLKPLDYYLWDNVKEVKPETIDALNDSIRDAIDEI